MGGCTLFVPPSTPTVTLVPSSGVVNSRVTIVGTGFGPTQGTSRVTLDGVAAGVVTWSDTSITARVPLLPTPDAEPNVVPVEVTVGGEVVGTGTFTVVRGILYGALRGQDQAICLANPDGSESFDLTSGAVDAWPQWSPDGTKIAFVRGPGLAGDLYVINADGTGETRLTHASGLNQFPAWSPDGTRIAFQTNRDGDLEIYVMDADGSGQTNLTRYPDVDAWPSWSPDGTRIVFHRMHLPIMSVDLPSPKLVFGDYEVFAMNADGTDVGNLSDNPATDWYPLWSPDGAKIAFQSDRNGAGEIFSMNPDGSHQTDLTQNPALDGAPAWSPDGSRIAFVSLRDGNPEIYVMNADGSGQMRLTNSPGWDAGPSWSADGSQIAFESDRDGMYHVYVVNADGTNVRRLTSEASVYPVWTESRWLPTRP